MSAYEAVLEHPKLVVSLHGSQMKRAASPNYRSQNGEKEEVRNVNFPILNLEEKIFRPIHRRKGKYF